MSFYSQYKDKLNYIFVAFICFLIIYISIEFLLPIFLPFIIGFALSRLILPGVRFLNKKLNFHNTTANIIMIIILITVLSCGIYFIIAKLTTQLSDFIKNWGNFKDSVENVTRNCCNAIERFTGLSGDSIYANISREANNAINLIQSKITPELMNYSIATIKGVFEGFIFLLITFISLFFFTKDNDNIMMFFNNCTFSKEIGFVKHIFKQVITAYVKAQIIIITLVAILCTIGFTIIKNPYSILYGIIVGILDILPLIGAGTFLVPMSIYYCLQGKYLYGVILFILFIICYLLREILEPKLMGNSIGIHPLTSLISVFAGYKLFGFLGMLIGPFGYVFISEALKVYTLKSQ